MKANRLSILAPAGNLADQALDLTQGMAPCNTEELSALSELEVSSLLAGNLDNLPLRLEIHLSELVAGTLTGLAKLPEVDGSGDDDAVARTLSDRVKRNRVSADPALEGLHQAEGRIVSYSGIEGQMDNGIGPAIRVENLWRSAATEQAEEAKSEGHRGKCCMFHDHLPG